MTPGHRTDRWPDVGRGDGCGGLWADENVLDDSAGRTITELYLPKGELQDARTVLNKATLTNAGKPL